MESNWASVTDQSGIYAGSGGFEITVGNNTDLKGGVIASEAEDKSKNRLDTGTISFEDIENKADFNVDHVSINVSVGSSLGYTPTPGAPSIYNNNGKDSSTTKSAVEEGTLIVRDTDKQTQDVNDLSRDTENANDPLGQIFDKQKEQDRMDALDLVKDITAQAHDVVNKYDLINAEEKYKGLSDSERDELKKKVEQELKDKGLPATDDAIDNYIINQFVQNDGIGNMGGSFSKGLDAASSIISGIITGDITGGLAGASAPYLAGLIKDKTKGNDEANRIAHAILGAAVAAAQGNSALAGGAGALTGEVMADIIRETLYGKEVKDLTEAEKQNISNLAQIASGLAVAAGGGSVSDVGTAASASKNAVENNYLSKGQMHDYIDELQGCGSSGNPGLCAENVKKKYDEIDEKQHQDLVDACSTNPSSSACFNHIKNAVEGGSVLFTEADLNSLLGEAGDYSVADLCKGLPDSCSTILNNQDWKNQQDADYNLNNPILIAERAKDARYILSYLGMDTSSMTDKEAVDKVNEIGLMTSAGIMGAGKGKGSGKDNTTGKVNQVKPQVLDPKFANDTWSPIKRYELVQKDGVWYTVGNNGTMYRARGTYDFVTINGKTYVSNTSSSSNVGHFDISRGASQVDYAGSVKFGWSDGTRGILQGFDNSSGHYKPSANDARQSGFPLDKFKDIHNVK